MILLIIIYKINEVFIFKFFYIKKVFQLNKRAIFKNLKNNILMVNSFIFVMYILNQPN